MGALLFRKKYESKIGNFLAETFNLACINFYYNEKTFKN